MKTGPHHQSEPSGAPSAYQRKRVRLSTTPSPAPSPGHSRPPTVQQQNAENTGSWSSRTSGPPLALLRAASARAASTRSGPAPPSTPTPATRPLHRSQSNHSPAPSQIGQVQAHHSQGSGDYRRAERRRSMSEMSIPIGSARFSSVGAASDVCARAKSTSATANRRQECVSILYKRQPSRSTCFPVSFL